MAKIGNQGCLTKRVCVFSPKIDVCGSTIFTFNVVGM